MKLKKILLPLLVIGAIVGSALAQSRIHVDLKETRLANGLRVITVEDHSAPVIAINVTYNVGSRDERKGRTGFAHLFEHMMFQGSENVGKSEHFILIQNNGGTSSRLYQKLVREKEMVTGVGAFPQETRGVGGFNITATLRPNVKSDDVEAAIYEEIARLQKEPIADWELLKAKNNTRRNFVNGLQSSLARANSIGIYAVYYNDPNLINTRVDKVAAVTKEDVQRVANKYLKETNRTVVITVPKAGSRGPQPGTMQ